MHVFTSNMIYGFIAGIVSCFLICNILNIIQDFTQELFIKIIDISQNSPAYATRVGYYFLLHALRIIFGLMIGLFYFKICQFFTLIIADKYEFNRNIIQFVSFFEYASWFALFIYILQRIKSDAIYGFWIVAGYLLGYMCFSY